MPPRTILVTGGAGFIGSHTCKLLAKSGYRAVSFDNFSTGHRDAVRFGPSMEGDIRDRSALDRVMAEWRPHAIIHFAAHAYVGESVFAPDIYYDNNVVGLLTVLNSARRFGIAHVVFSSSCATYGLPDQLPIREDMPQRPINPYGETKLIGEHILRDYARAFGLRYAALRYFNACGADRDGELRERHDPETHIIPRALMAAAGRLPHLDVFGGDYETPDGTCIRDYIHVEDLAQGHVRALEYLDRHDGSFHANLGTGHGVSILDIIHAIESVAGRKVPVNMGPRREGDPPALYADPSRARDLFGFEATRSDLHTIVRSAMPSFGL